MQRQARLAGLEDGVRGRLAVQALAEDGAAAAKREAGGQDVHGAAERGVAGASTALPHAGPIQASFGHHDLSALKAQVGGAATGASEGLGARAYAYGDRVAFAGTPDLHTAAHEAAHVVQQRGGVHLKDDVGQVGDRYEAHADRVADAVVRGESAERLLDGMAPATGASGGRAIQRDAEPAGGAQAQAPAARPRDQTRDPAFRQRVLAAASGNIDDINDLMSYGAFDWAITDSEAIRAIRILQNLPGPNRLVVCQELARGSALGRLLENLPGGASGQCPNAYLTVCAVARDPRRTRQFFDGSPRIDPAQDGVALGLVMAQLPDELVREQALGQARGQVNAHLHEWIAITPDPPKTQLQARYDAARQQATSDVQAQQQRQEHERSVDATVRQRMEGTTEAARSFRDRIHRMEDLLSYGVFDWAITDSDARHVFQIFAQCGSREEVEVTVHALDARNQTFMNRFLDNIPQSERYGAQQRTFMRIISGRRPENNVPFVREMLSTGFLNSVSGEEAGIAFQLIRSMPRDLQDQIRTEQNGELWRRLEGSLDQRQANDRDANTYGNAEERQQLMLAFREGCATWPAPQLRAQIEMLCRMGQDELVERSLGEAGLDRNPEYGWIYERWGFARAGQPRNEEVFARWRDNVAGDRGDPGFFARAGAGLGLLGQALGAGASVLTTGQTSQDIDLNQAQTAAGGSMGGMVLAERQGAEDNRIQADVNTDTGNLALAGQSLNIASIARMSDGVSLQTGPVRIAGVDVALKWPTPRDAGSRMRIAIQSITAQDVWRTTPQAMLNVGSASITGLVIEAARPPGNSPGDRQQGIGMLFQELQETATRLMTLLQGASPDANQLSAQLGQSLGQLQATVQIASIEVQNVSTSNGGFVGGAQVRGVQVAIQNRRKGDVLRERLAELERLGRERALTAEEQTERQSVEQRILALAPLEARERELSAREGDHAGRPSHLPILGTGAPEDGLNAGERDELSRLRSELTVSSAEVQVADIHVTQVSMGGRQAEDLRVQDLRAEVTAAPRTGQGDAQGGSEASTRFQVGSVTGANLRMQGSNRLEATEARIAELNERMTAGQATDEERALFTRLSAQVAEVHRMIAVRDRVRLDPGAEAQLGEADRALYTRAQAELAGWTDREAGTSIRSLAITGEGGQAAISGSADLSGGSVSAQVSHARLEGVEQGGRQIASLDVRGASVGAQVSGDLRSGAQPAGPQQGMLSRLASAQFDAERLEMAGYHEEGLALSATLTREQRQLHQAADLGQATSAQTERLAALPGLLEEAHRAEARLSELRAQQATPEGLSREQQAEMAALAARCDPHTRDIRRLEANHVHAETTEHGMALSMGQAGSGTRGLVMEGFQQGTVGPDGTRTTTRSIDSVSAETLRVEAGMQGGISELGDTAAVFGNREMQADVSGTGLNMQGFTQGQQGQAGYQHIDSVTADRFAVGYHRGADGSGSASLDVDGAEVRGVTRNSSRLAGLDQALGVYAAQVSSGRPLTAEQEARRAELQHTRQEYERLQERLAGARSAGQRRSIQRQIDAWERVSEQTISRIAASDVQAQVTGVGDVLDEHWNLDDQHLGVRAHVGHAEVGEVRGTDARGRSRRQLRSATVDDLNVRGTNVMGAGGEGSQLHAEIGSVDAQGVSTGSASIGRAHGRGITADVTTTVDADHARHTGISGRARSLSASGVNAGGVSVGHASLSSASFGVQNAGERGQSASLSAGGVSASGVRYHGGGTSAGVDRVRGRGLSVGMSGSGVSGGLRHVEGSGASFHSGTTEAGAATFDADGAYFSSRGGQVSGGARHVGATGVHYSGDVVRDEATVGHRSAGADTVDASDVSGSAGPDGTFAGHVGSATVTGGRYHEVDAQGQTVRHGSGERVTATQVDVRGDRSGRIDASFGVIRGDRLEFHDTTNPQQRIDAVVSYFEVGSPDQVSVVHWDGSRITDAQVARLAVGQGSVEIGGHSLTLRGAVTTGLVSVHNLDPGNITAAGGSVQIRNVQADELLYVGSGTQFYMRRGTVDRAFMEGTGQSEMMVGATGVRAERLDLSHHSAVTDAQGQPVMDSRGRPATRSVEFHGDHARIEGAYATMRQGASWELVQARVTEAGAENLQMRYVSTADVATPGTAGPQAPVDLAALRHANGQIELGGSFDVGGYTVPAGLRIPLRDGHVTPAEIQLVLGRAGVPARYILAATQVIVSGLSPAAGAAVGVARAAAEIPLPVERIGEWALNGDSDGQPTDLGRTRGVRIRAHIDDIGGDVRWRDTFRGRVQGGSITAQGDIGRDLTVGARGLDIRDVEAAGGQAQIGQVGAREGTVRVRDLASGRTDVELQVRDGVVRDVRYEGGPQSTDGSRSDAAFQRQAQAREPAPLQGVDGASPPPASTRRPQR